MPIGIIVQVGDQQTGREFHDYEECRRFHQWLCQSPELLMRASKQNPENQLLANLLNSPEGMIAYALGHFEEWEEGLAVLQDAIANRVRPLPVVTAGPFIRFTPAADTPEAEAILEQGRDLIIQDRLNADRN